jgi:hypothetical protein
MCGGLAASLSAQELNYLNNCDCCDSHPSVKRIVGGLDGQRDPRRRDAFALETVADWPHESG